MRMRCSVGQALVRQSNPRPRHLEDVSTCQQQASMFPHLVPTCMRLSTLLLIIVRCMRLVYGDPPVAEKHIRKICVIFQRLLNVLYNRDI